MTVWNDIVGVLQQYVFPVVGTVVTTGLPIVTPYVISRIGSRFADLRDMIQKRLDVIDYSVEHRITQINTKLNNMITRTELRDVITSEVSKITAPIIEELVLTREILATVVDNSRIPTDVKERLKNTQGGVKKTVEDLNAIIDKHNEDNQTLQSKIDALESKVALLEREKELLKTVKVEKPKNQKKKRKEKTW